MTFFESVLSNRRPFQPFNKNEFEVETWYEAQSFLVSGIFQDHWKLKAIKQK